MRIVDKLKKVQAELVIYNRWLKMEISDNGLYVDHTVRFADDAIDFNELEKVVDLARKHKLMVYYDQNKHHFCFHGNK